jgi:hypothetical protein
MPPSKNGGIFAPQQIKLYMKRIITLMAIACSTTLFAQTDAQKQADQLRKDLEKTGKVEKQGWSKGGLINIGLNQGMLENWAAGGERMSLAANGQVNAFLNNLNGNKVWENNLDAYYGLNYVASNNFVPRKLDDRLDISSRYSLQPKSWTNAPSKLKRHTYLTGLLRFQSQFTPGYNYDLANFEKFPISELFAPAYLTLALGATYRPNENFSVFFSPLAARMTVTKASYTKFADAFGVKKGKTSRMEMGAYLTARYKTQLTKNISYNTRLDLYSNYLAKNTVENGITLKKDNPGNVDVLWDNFFAMKISKFIGAGLGFTMIYDNDIPGQKTKSSTISGVSVPNSAYGPLGWWQLKQVLNVGFSYKL